MSQCNLQLLELATNFKQRCRLLNLFFFLSILLFLIPVKGICSNSSKAELNSIQNTVGCVDNFQVLDKTIRFNCKISSTNGEIQTIWLSFPEADILRVNVGAEELLNIENYSSYELIEEEHQIQIKTDYLLVEVEKAEWKLHVYKNNSGERIYSEEGLNILNGNDSKITIGAKMDIDEHFYGFGEKFNGLDQRGNEVVMELYSKSRSTDHRAYKAIPFFISSRQYGFLVNSSERVVFHMGDLDKTRYSIENPSDKMEYYLFANQNPLKIISQYTAITGRPPLVPQWSLEPWLSRRSFTGWSNVHTPEMDVDAMIDDGFRLGVILWEGIRNIFPGNQASEMHRLSNKWQLMGIKQVTWSQAGYMRSKNTSDKIKRSFFILNKDSSCLTIDRDGQSMYIDVTNKDAMNWWIKEHYEHQISDKNGLSQPWHWNLDGIKIDFCEFFPKEDLEIITKSNIKGMHTQHPVLFSEQIYHWLQEIKPEGGITWVRGGGLGLQRVGFVWGGDRNRTFSQLKGTIAASLGLSVCGVSLIGHDVGGYIGGHDPYSREIYIRGVQYATFSPAFHDHGSAPAPWEQDPYGKENYQFYSRVRYNIIPYLYHYVNISHTKGIPLMRTLYMHHPEDSNTFAIDDQYYLGQEMIIAPIISKDNHRTLYLPQGDWIDFWTQKEYSGKNHLVYKAPLNRIPVFVKNASIIPLRLNDEMQIGGLFPFEKKNKLLLAFRFFRGGGNKMSWDINDDQFNIAKQVVGDEITIAISNVQESFGLMVDGILPGNVNVNGSQIEEINPEIFKATNQGWMFDSVQNQTLIKICFNMEMIDYSIVLNNCIEIKSDEIPSDFSLDSPVISRIKCWESSVDIDFTPIIEADSYRIDYWMNDIPIKLSTPAIKTPFRLNGLVKNKTYNFQIFSQREDSLSEGSAVMQADTQEHIPIFFLDTFGIFIHALNFLSRDKLDLGDYKYTYGVYSPKNTSRILWIKANKNKGHHQYFRWYQMEEIFIKQGINHLVIHVPDKKTELERIYLSTDNTNRPTFKDEFEGNYLEDSILIRKTEIKQGNVDFAIARGAEKCSNEIKIVFE